MKNSLALWIRVSAKLLNVKQPPVLIGLTPGAISIQKYFVQFGINVHDFGMRGSILCHVHILLYVDIHSPDSSSTDSEV